MEPSWLPCDSSRSLMRAPPGGQRHFNSSLVLHMHNVHRARWAQLVWDLQPFPLALLPDYLDYNHDSLKANCQRCPSEHYWVIWTLYNEQLNVCEHARCQSDTSSRNSCYKATTAHVVTRLKSVGSDLSTIKFSVGVIVWITHNFQTNQMFN